MTLTGTFKHPVYGACVPQGELTEGIWEDCGAAQHDDLVKEQKQTYPNICAKWYKADFLFICCHNNQ